MMGSSRLRLWRLEEKVQETGEEEVETERSKGSHLRFLNSHSKIYHAAVNYLKLRFDVSLVSASPPDYVRNAEKRPAPCAISGQI